MPGGFAASFLSQVNATSSDGRCAPYCLTSFFELLHSKIDSYDAGLIKSAFFARVLPSAFWRSRAALFPSVTHLLRLMNLSRKEEATMQHLYQTRMSDPVPIDPVPVPDPIPTPQPIPDPPSPDPRPIDDPPPHMR